MLTVVWFRRDLRVHDNPALAEAVDGPVVPLFVLDPALVGASRMGPPRLAYLGDALSALDTELRRLGGRLVVRRGDPRRVVPAVADEVRATEVRWSADVSPFAARRDGDVARRVRAGGRRVTQHDGTYVQPPGTITTKSGGAYRVFTPFFRTWRRQAVPDPRPAPTRIRVPDGVTGEPVPTREDLAPAAGADIDPGGEPRARERLDRFLENDASRYHERRDRLDLSGTSRLSAALHFGCLSAGEILHRLDLFDAGHEAFARELAFRDFYGHVLHAFPEVVTSEFDTAFSQLPWQGDGEDLRAWQEARTGYPVVDAAMRQLDGEAWMHNRARMIVASFLCKDLLVDWRLGEAHFLRRLADGDLASNNGGWQWAAGTGADAQPYFRIFNPVTQGRKYDPGGTYVRRWLPELAGVPDRWIHRPWEMPADEARACGIRIGSDYPAPIVEHQAARHRAVAWFREHRAATRRPSSGVA